MITIRPATTADAAAIATVRAESWRAAYGSLIPAAALAGATAPASVSAYTERLITRSCAGILVAEQPQPKQPGPAGAAAAELYAIYVLPAYWSGQAGWRLLTEVVNQATAQRYASLSLWVLEANSRARRFYQRGGFAVTGESQVLDDLGGVTEIRYWRPLAG